MRQHNLVSLDKSIDIIADRLKSVNEALTNAKLELLSVEELVPGGRGLQEGREGPPRDILYRHPRLGAPPEGAAERGRADPGAPDGALPGEAPEGDRQRQQDRDHQDPARQGHRSGDRGPGRPPGRRARQRQRPPEGVRGPGVPGAEPAGAERRLQLPPEQGHGGEELLHGDPRPPEPDHDVQEPRQDLAAPPGPRPGPVGADLAQHSGHHANEHRARRDRVPRHRDRARVRRRPHQERMGRRVVHRCAAARHHPAARLDQGRREDRPRGLPEGQRARQRGVPRPLQLGQDPVEARFPKVDPDNEHDPRRGEDAHIVQPGGLLRPAREEDAAHGLRPAPPDAAPAFPQAEQRPASSPGSSTAPTWTATSSPTPSSGSRSWRRTSGSSPRAGGRRSRPSSSRTRCSPSSSSG